MTDEKTCILVISNVAYDGRVLRQIGYARRNYEVDVIDHGDWALYLPCKESCKSIEWA